MRGLHREFRRAGSDVLQAFTFYATEDRLEVNSKKTGIKALPCKELNASAAKIAKEVAAEGDDILVAGGITPCTSYMEGKGKDACIDEFRKQAKVFVEHGLDFIILEVHICNYKILPECL